MKLFLDQPRIAHPVHGMCVRIDYKPHARFDDLIKLLIGQVRLFGIELDIRTVIRRALCDLRRVRGTKITKVADDIPRDFSLSC